MPRMRVDLRPSTVQFDDGENPVASGLARFGVAMSQLPVQIARIKMEQAQQDEHHNEFQAEHALRMQQFGQEQSRQDEHAREFNAENTLRMGADQRAAEEHAQHMTAERGKNIYEGYVDPQPADPLAPTPEENTNMGLHQEGADYRAAQKAALEHRGATSGKGTWQMHGDRTNGLWMYNTETGEKHAVVDDGTPGGEGLPKMDPAKIEAANKAATARSSDYNPGFFSRQASTMGNFYAGHDAPDNAFNKPGRAAAAKKPISRAALQSKKTALGRPGPLTDEDIKAYADAGYQITD